MKNPENIPNFPLSPVLEGFEKFFPLMKCDDCFFMK